MCEIIRTATVAAIAAVSLLVMGGCIWRACFAKRVQPADNSYCYVCHANYKKDELSRAHQPAGVGCETCHGPSDKHSSDEDGLIPPQIMYPRQKINRYCMTCHPKDKIGQIEDHKPLPAAKVKKVCTDCHGKHRLKHRTRIWDKSTGKLISDDGVRMMYDRK